MRICFATNNAHKIHEVRQAVGQHFQIVSLDELSVYDDLPETQNTLEGNALQKAQFVFEKFNIPCFADDSGLEVEALNNEPGVYSARYAGPQRNSSDNISLLLQKLGSNPNRKARFRTVIALVGMGNTMTFEGVVEGQITYELRGDGGFGYDPVFMPLGYTKTFAEMSTEEKNKLSHRGKAVNLLTDHLKEL